MPFHKDISSLFQIKIITLLFQPLFNFQKKIQKKGFSFRKMYTDKRIRLNKF